MSARTIAIGDIHGCSLALDALLDAIQPEAEDTIIPLGDFVDRGFDSRSVLDRLIALEAQCRLVPILGNHDEMLLQSFHDKQIFREWLLFGGIATLDSYGDAGLEAIPEAHIDFLKHCRDFFETETHIFVHASYDPRLPMSDQSRSTLRWVSLRDGVPGPHVSGKTVITGHTSQKTGEILDLGYLKCIDTYCYGGKWLTALDVSSGQVWQACDSGRLRR